MHRPLPSAGTGLAVVLGHYPYTIGQAAYYCKQAYSYGR